MPTKTMTKKILAALCGCLLLGLAACVPGSKRRAAGQAAGQDAVGHAQGPSRDREERHEVEPGTIIWLTRKK